MRNIFFVIPVLAFLGALNYFNQVWQYTAIPEHFGELLYQTESAREHAEFAANLLASPSASEIAVPVIGVRAQDIADSYGNPRSGDRSHEGTDIFADRGTPIRAATEGIVARIGSNRLGGTVVYILGPGGERYYYAHLEEVDPYLTVGQIVSTTTLIGTVGTSGNATGTPPHLHFGIYTRGGATNPYPRLQS